MFKCEIIAPLVTQKSLRFANGHAYNPSKADKERLQWQMRPYALKELIKEPCILKLTFFFPIPKRTSKNMRKMMLAGIIRPDIRPDNSNLAYIIENALQGIAYDDDKRVCSNIYHKFYGEVAKTVVEVEPIMIRQIA